MSAVSKIIEMVQVGVISVEEGWDLIWLERLIKWKRKPWYERAWLRLCGGGP